MSRIPQALTGAADRVLDALVVPGYSKIGVAARRHWWPADPPPFPRRVDVVVTGASSGLGAAAAQGLAALGARIQMVDARPPGSSRPPTGSERRSRTPNWSSGRPTSVTSDRCARSPRPCARS